MTSYKFEICSSEIITNYDKKVVPKTMTHGIVF